MTPAEASSPGNDTGRAADAGSGRALLYAAVVLVASLAVFAPVRRFEFLTYDDADYVTNNPHVREGLTGDTIRWAFTSFEYSNWHPLTWLSLALDAQFFGLDPGWFHVTNAVLHALAAAVLFTALFRMTASPGCSLTVALLFALHPLHVESVAWVAERKDVLSGLFWMLTLLAYDSCVRRPGIARYLAVVLSLALGLMAKPMLVTLPFVLLLLDVWPLARRSHGQSTRRLLQEKLPLLALVAISCIITYRAQQAGGAVASLERVPFPSRLANALLSGVIYLGQMLAPLQLSVFKPLQPRSLSEPAVLAAAALLLAISLAAILQVRRRPYLLVGWLWYLGTLVPVIGLVQVGAQAHADRYTYIPLIGIFIALVWLAADALAFLGRRSTVLTALVVLGACAVLTTRQLSFWRNSETLFLHALEVSGSTPPAHFALATHYRNQGDYERAVTHLRHTLELAPDRLQAWSVLGYCLLRLNRAGEAGFAFSHVPTKGVKTPDDCFQYGLAMLQRRLPGAAAAFFAQTIQLRPQDANAYLHLALAMSHQQAPMPARHYLAEARRIDPEIVRQALWQELDSALPAGSERTPRF